jgi:hydroxymethylpyrimidine/phosphomethylpyrimidine kinase
MRPPVALTIAGSDPSGGAGIQADLKTFSALGAYGTSVVTSLTAQSTVGVTAVQVLPADFVAQQWHTLVDDVRIDTIKIGMLATAELVELVDSFLDDSPCEHIVLDPVMVATSGDRLLDQDAVTAVRRLLPRTSLVTPNLAEAAVLLDTDPVTTVDLMEEQARQLLDLGAQRVLLKGGHLPGGAERIDVLAGRGWSQRLHAPHVDTRNTHGTGCTFSSAIAALRPRRDSWDETARDAKQWLTAALVSSEELEVGHGAGPVHHFHALWENDQATDC